MKLRFRVGRKQARKEARKNGDIKALADAMRALKKDKGVESALMPPFSWSIYIISRLIIHLTATYNYSKMYLIL